MIKNSAIALSHDGDVAKLISPESVICGRNGGDKKRPVTSNKGRMEKQLCGKTNQVSSGTD